MSQQSSPPHFIRFRGAFLVLALAALVSPLFLLNAQDPPKANGAPANDAAIAKAVENQGKVAPKKIVLIAGPKDPYHGEGTHEYGKTIAKMKAALEGSNVAPSVVVTAVADGWPKDTKILDEADTIVLISAGADRKTSDHPFLTPERLAVLEKQMDRGCGLVMMHWSLFIPVAYEKQFANWIGGFFDFERGQTANGWKSAIKFATVPIVPVPKHPISQGVPPFQHHDEFYYQIHFAENDARVKPIVTIELPDVKEPQVIAWTVDRNDGGRSFGFTGGHFQESWENEDYETLLLNAVCWTARLPIPPSGVHKAQAFDDLWTPKPHLGKDDLPRERESDWVDARIRESDVGPYYTTSIIVPEQDTAVSAPADNRTGPTDPNMVLKGLAIQLDAPSGKQEQPAFNVLFDKQAMVVSAGWPGQFLNFSDRRFGLLEKPTIGGEIAWRLPPASAWQILPSDAAAAPEEKPQPAGELIYNGLTLDGDRVILSYSVAGCAILESPTVSQDGSRTAVVREMECGPTAHHLRLPIVQWAGAKIPPDGKWLEQGDEALLVRLTGTNPPKTAILTSPEDGAVALELGPNESTERFGLAIWRGPKSEINAIQEQLDAAELGQPLAERVKNPAPRWGEPLVTQGVIGKPEKDAPFAVDTITLPDENRFKALFFMGGFDFTPDGACYLATAHGDIWKATGIDEELDEITWHRFATGIYEPLGLKVRDGEIFVLGRDQITRLHDFNNDGETDYYENFNDDLTDQGQSHAYAMCLETDVQGNFYFLKSGAPETPHGGSLIKVSADGKTMTTFATGFRHPNGMSIGPDGTITAADNEGNWVPVTRLDFVTEGAFCGHVPTAHMDPVPNDPGKPVCWLPRVVDNSAGGQAWVPAGSWGPLANKLIHLSYGACTASLILTEQVNGVWQGGAVRMPLPDFLSGVCRGRFRTEGTGADGHLYVAGLNGWSSTAERDGCFQRVRYLEKPIQILTGIHIHENGIELEFPEPLDAERAANPDRFSADIWTYRWSKEYGSSDYSIANPGKEGRDPLKVTGATVSSDGRKVFLAIDGLQPAMQLRVQAGLQTADGHPLSVDYYGTIHELRSAKTIDQKTATANE